MLSEKTVVDQVTVLEDGQLQVREARIISDETGEISRAFHRYVVKPGDSISSIESENRLLMDVVIGVHTAERIAAFRRAREVRNGTA